VIFTLVCWYLVFIRVATIVTGITSAIRGPRAPDYIEHQPLPAEDGNRILQSRSDDSNSIFL
jgi:hypothetical protein